MCIIVRVRAFQRYQLGKDLAKIGDNPAARPNIFLFYSDRGSTYEGFEPSCILYLELMMMMMMILLISDYFYPHVEISTPISG